MKMEYEENGYYLIEHVLNQEHINLIIEELNVFSKGINNYGIRDLMNKRPFIRKLAMSTPLLAIAKKILGSNAKPVRSVFFDKVPNANWNVAWHQDTAIAVKEKINSPGFGKWREKEGVLHVEPPDEYLEKMLTIRIHLDDTNKENGVLRVIPGTHRNGRIKSQELMNIVENSEVVECNAKSGDVLLMCPLLFHSSRKAIKPSHRRIVHIEYSAMDLPGELAWYEYSNKEL